MGDANQRFLASEYYDKQTSLRLEGTCEWIFHNPVYCAWASDEFLDDAAKLLWISAPAGYGKTVLCARIIEQLNSRLTSPIAYFFSSPHAQSGGQPSAIVRFWIAQIAQIDSDALDLVRGFCQRSEAGRASQA